MKNTEGYIEVEYRIAVILNESGLIRNTYSNVVPNLSSLMVTGDRKFKRFEKKYIFVPFTRNNLNELFCNTGINSIESFDAIFISTNSTNDSQVLNILNDNKIAIENFIKKNKGVFLGSQKKLSKKDNLVSFLPDSLSFKYVTRPEEKSSEGKIHIKNKNDSLVLNCDEENINYICHFNRFKDHVYRSYMEPQYLDMFEDILVDEQDNSRRLLIRAKQSKVVYSTISLDYEEQNDLLKNIIIYITEGISTIAFFADTSKKGFSFANKYNSLLLNAQLNKLPISIYKNLEVNDEIKSKKIFVISSDYDINETNKFWRQIQNDNQNSNVNLKKLIYLNDSSATESIITEYKNYSEIDVKLKKVILWVQSKIREKNERKDEQQKKLWGTSFWATYETMSFIFELYKVYGLEYLRMIQSYGISFLEASIHHYREFGKEEQGSYDGMLNCSCALLELFVLFDLDKLKNSDYINSSVLSRYNIELTINYILDYIENDTSYIDSEMVLLSLLNLKRYEVKNELILKLISNNSYIDNLLKQVIEHRILTEYNFALNESNKYILIRDNYKNRDLQELCKDIEVMAYALTNTTSDIISDDIKVKIERILVQHLLQIKYLQTNGYWTNFNRTSAVLKILIKATYNNNLLSYQNDILNSVLSQIIMSALNYVLKEIDNVTLSNDESRMWMKDLEATVTLSHALCLYNRYNRNDASKIEMTIIDGSNDILSVEALDNSAKELTSMRFEKDEILIKNSRLTQELDVSMKENEEKNNQLLYERNNFKNRRRMLIIVLIAFAVIAIEEAIVIANNNLISELMIWVYSLLGTIVAFGVSLLLKNLIESKLFPSDEKLFKINKNKNKFKKEKNEK